MEGDLQSKMQASAVHANRVLTVPSWRRNVMAQRQTFSQKAQSFEQDRARRSNEERGKLVEPYPDCCEKRSEQPEHRPGC